MFEEIRFEQIMDRMLDNIPDKFDKREGSVLYTSLAPAGVEFTKAYNKMVYILDQSFADTSNYENLIRRAKERGLEPLRPTKAVLKAEFDTQVSNGTRFGINELSYVVLEHIEGNYYMIECEQKGIVGNSYMGNIVPFNYIDGLTVAQIVEILIPARDMEDIDDFRLRYFSSFESEAFGGNIRDYKDKVLGLDGIGGVKVDSVWNGGGTVKIIIIDSELKEPSEYLVEEIQNELDPVGYSGLGYGIAPIGHDVTVVGASTYTIGISSKIELDTGQSWSNVKPRILDKLEEYFNSLNNEWMELDNIIVRISQLESIILEVNGVIDISNTKLNGDPNNITVDSESIVKLGDIINEFN